MKSIIYYYSLSGKTGIAAETLAKLSKAEKREVQETKNRNIFSAFITGAPAALHHKTSSIKPVDVNLKNYDTVFIGSPIWAGNVAPAINALVAQLDLKNKNVILFVTMGGSGAQKGIDYFTKAVAAKGGKVIDSVTFRSSKKEELIKQVQDFGKKYQK